MRTKILSTIVLTGLLLVCQVSAAPIKVPVSSYDFTPGTSTLATWPDDSSRTKLTDGLVPVTPELWDAGFTAGWYPDAPEITFDFGSDVTIAGILFSEFGADYGYDTVDVYAISDPNDPNTIVHLGQYNNSQRYTTATTDIITEEVFLTSRSTARYLTLQFAGTQWTMLNEVDFRIYEPNTIIITDQPADAAALVGNDVEFSVGVFTEAIPASYQWKKDGVELTGETNATLQLTDVSIADEGGYSCLVTSPGNTTGMETDAAVLSVTEIPALSAFGSRVMAHDPLAYWSFDEADGSLAVDLVSLDINRTMHDLGNGARVTHGDFGNAVATTQGDASTMWVSNDLNGQIYNGPFAIEMMVRFVNQGDLNNYLMEVGQPGLANAPSLLKGYNGDPNNVYLYSGGAGGIAGGNASIDDAAWHHMVVVDYDNNMADCYIDGVKVAGFGYDYGWDGTLYPDAQTRLSLQDTVALGGTAGGAGINSVELDELAFYDLSGLNETELGIRGQSLALQSDLDGPAYITEDPAATTAPPATTAVLHVAAAGAEPISYQWKKDGVDLTDDGNVSGATTPVLSLANVTKAADEGSYTCYVSNAEGNELSAAAVLTVECFFDLDGDINGDCVVDMIDFSMLAADWLERSDVQP